MSSLTNSMKKLKHKREEFKRKMNELMTLHDASSIPGINDCVLNFSANSTYNSHDDCTVPKQVYNSSQDIVLQAFNREVLNSNSLEPDCPTINLSFHSDVSANTSYEQEDQADGSVNPITLTISEDTSNLDEEFLLNMSREEFMSLIACIPTLNERCCSLESKCSTLEGNYSNLENKYHALEEKFVNIQGENVELKNKLSSHCSISVNQINKINSYSRRNSLLGHKLRKVPTNLHGTEFSKYVAAELRNSMPGLSISHQDIDTSHILYYESDGEVSYPVVVIKFVNRDLRNIIWHWDKSVKSDIFFTEHLTVSNRKLFRKAQEAYPQAWTEQCRMYIMDSFGRKKEIVEEDDLNIKPFVSSSSSYVPSDNTNVQVRLNDLPSSNRNNYLHQHQRNFHPNVNRKRNSRNSYHPRKSHSNRKFNRNSNQHRQSYKTQVYHPSNSNNHQSNSIVSSNPLPSAGTHQNSHFNHPFLNHDKVGSRNGYVQNNENPVFQQDNPDPQSVHSTPNLHYMQNNLCANINSVPMNTTRQQLIPQQQSVYNTGIRNFGPRGMINNYNSRFPMCNMARPPGYGL